VHTNQSRYILGTNVDTPAYNGKVTPFDIAWRGKVLPRIRGKMIVIGQVRIGLENMYVGRYLVCNLYILMSKIRILTF
jgi:hypothetical protein